MSQFASPRKGDRHLGALYEGACPLHTIRTETLRGPERRAIPQPAAASASQDQPIRVGVALVTADAVVRDRNGRFVSDLVKDDFELYEDGARQTIVSFLLSHGGRIMSLSAPPPPALTLEGMRLRPVRPAADVTGDYYMLGFYSSNPDPTKRRRPYRDHGDTTLG